MEDQERGKVVVPAGDGLTLVQQQRLGIELTFSGRKCLNFSKRRSLFNHDHNIMSLKYEQN